MNKENYTPEILPDGNVKMVIKGEKCSICSKIMVRKVNYYKDPFPLYIEISQESQVRLNDSVVFNSGIEIDYEKFCMECKDSGKITFKCALCGEDHPISDIKEDIGDPAEYLCINCFKTASAEEWEKKIEKLKESHRYDYE